MQLQSYITKPGEEYGLCINTDVSLWLDKRNSTDRIQLRQAPGWVFIDLELHREFDKFKEEETSPHFSLIKRMELLDMWKKKQRGHISVVERYGHHYYRLCPSQLDDICHWIQSMRRRFDVEGRDVFLSQVECQ